MYLIFIKIRTSKQHERQRYEDTYCNDEQFHGESPPLLVNMLDFLNLDHRTYVGNRVFESKPSCRQERYFDCR